jgi:hypothetical protein
VAPFACGLMPAKFLSNSAWTDPTFHGNSDITIFAYGEVLLGKINEIDIGLMLGFDDLKCGITRGLVSV